MMSEKRIQIPIEDVLLISVGEYHVDVEDAVVSEAIRIFGRKDIDQYVKYRDAKNRYHEVSIFYDQGEDLFPMGYIVVTFLFSE